MTINPGAINAYAKTSGLGAAGGGGVTGDQSGGFGSMVKDALETIAETQKASEQTAVKAVKGEADLTDVVTAVSNAEVTLQTAVTVRDRVVEAYQQVMRMPI